MYSSSETQWSRNESQFKDYFSLTIMLHLESLDADHIEVETEGLEVVEQPGDIGEVDAAVNIEVNALPVIICCDAVKVSKQCNDISEIGSTVAVHVLVLSVPI